MIWSAKRALRCFAYASGVLGLMHHLRNRRTLTVFMFHRVLPADSGAYSFSEREFAITVDGFRQTLDFICRHYNVVSHEAIRANVEHNVPLPDRAGLITFDDGWRDTLIYAFPELKQRNLPAVLFLSTEVIELSSERWWQDRLVEALTVEGNRERIESLLGIEGAGKTDNERLWKLTASLASLPDGQRHKLLDQIVANRALGRQLLLADELASLQPDISVAGHGHTHAPMTHCEDPKNDLSASYEVLRSQGCDDWAMSYPHGAYDVETTSIARSVGFRVLYTSDAHLMDASDSLSADGLFGRIHIPENEWTCDNGRISNSKLATYLFFRPIVR